MGSKSKKHFQGAMIFSIVALIIISSNSMRFVNAFDIGIPEIPFLNFNFNFNGDSAESNSNSEAYSDRSTSYSPSVMPNVGDSRTHNDNSQEQLKATDGLNKDDFSCELPHYDSLPFPSFVNGSVNNCKEPEGDDEKDYGLNELYTKMPFTLPLIADYSDIPSTFLSGTNIVPAKIIPNQ